MSAKLIAARFPSKCYKCGDAIAGGASIWYDKDAARGVKACHAHCGGEAIPEPQSAPANAPSAFVRRRIGGETVYESHHDSVSEFCAQVPTLNAKRWNSGEFLRYSAGFDWYGVTGGMAGALATVTAGWSDGLRKVEESLKDIAAPLVSGMRRRVVRGDHGDELDIHRVNSGEFETAWSRRARRNSAFGHAQKTILVTISALGEVSPGALFWRGASAIKISDALVAAGYSVEIVGLISSGRIPSAVGDVDQMSTFTIKPFDMPLDRLELCTVTCLAGFWRSHGFKSRLCMPVDMNGSRRFGYAHEVIPERFNNADTIRGLDKVTTREQAQQFINNCMRSLNHEDQQEAA